MTVCPGMDKTSSEDVCMYPVEICHNHCKFVAFEKLHEYIMYATNFLLAPTVLENETYNVRWVAFIQSIK